jgi:hypothetical protein
MKALLLQSLIVSALALTLSGCEKNAESMQTSSVKKAGGSHEVVYPHVGTYVSNRILGNGKLPRAVLSKGHDYPGIKVTLIDTVCQNYLQQTKKLDFSYLKEGEVISIVKNNDLIIDADPEFHVAGFTRFSYGPSGWFAHWNYSPYTESEYPDVLFSSYLDDGYVFGKSSMCMVLSRYVKTFGFEIAPNLSREDIKVSVTYNGGSSNNDKTYFRVDQTISSPSGARLIAVTSEKPFDFISIDVKDPKPQVGFAIANIRYQLAD